MTDSVFKAPKAKRSMKGNTQSQQWSTSPRKRRRTKDDFVTFCSFVLEYTNYESMKQEDLRHRNNGSPLDSSGSTADSFTSESLSESTSSVFSSPEPDTDGETPHRPPHRPPHSRFAPGPDDSDEELITCFCMKPYGGRPMIECSECFTWIHFSCAKIRKTNVPEVFVCQNCRNTKSSTRKSGRMRSDKKVLDA